jgi:Transposase IS200 like
LGKELGVQIVSGVSSREHVHVLVEIPPQIAVSDVVRRVKGRSSHRVRMEFQELRKRTWGRYLRYFGRGAIFAPGAATSRTLSYFRILGSTNLRRRPVVVKFTNQKNPTMDGIELSGGSPSWTLIEPCASPRSLILGGSWKAFGQCSWPHRIKA